MTSGTVQPGSSSRVDTILVVDHEIVVRMLICEYLRHCGYKVIEAVSAEEAMVVLTADAGIDVVLCNAEMPGSPEGFGLAKWIRESLDDVRVILVGNLNRAADVASELCDNGPMLKRPYEPQVVVERIKRLLAERAYRK